MEVVKPKHGLLTLLRKKVINEEVQGDINDARTGQAAKEILFKHLHDDGSVPNLKIYCAEIIKADGYPRMQDLGRKMLNELEQGG